MGQSSIPNPKGGFSAQKVDLELSLSQVVESGGKNIKIAVMTKNEGLRLLKYTEVEDIVAGIEAKKTENSTFCREGLDIRVQ